MRHGRPGRQVQVLLRQWLVAVIAVIAMIAVVSLVSTPAQASVDGLGSGSVKCPCACARVSDRASDTDALRRPPCCSVEFGVEFTAASWVSPTHSWRTHVAAVWTRLHEPGGGRRIQSRPTERGPPRVRTPQGLRCCVLQV